MSYRSCPNCRANNRAIDTRCYNCEESLPSLVETPGVGAEPSLSVAEVSSETFAAVVSLGLVMGLGGFVGVAWEAFDLDLPFLLEELVLGVLCSTICAVLLGMYRGMMSHQIFHRALPAALLGAFVGACLYGFWWSFDPPLGGLGVGLVAGFCAGLPVIVSFGLAGGESRPLGTTEFSNLLLSLVLGAVIGLGFASEVEEWSLLPGFIGAGGLLPTLLGGRISLWDILHAMNRGSD